MLYIIDHYYAVDHEKYCLIIESDKEVNCIIEIISSIEFLFEEIVSEEYLLGNKCLLNILEEFYRMKDVKEKYRMALPLLELKSLKGGLFQNVHIQQYDIDVVHIDWYEARESCCGKYREIMNKHLPKEQRLMQLKTYIKNHWKEEDDL